MKSDFSLDHISPDKIFPDPIVHRFSDHIRWLENCRSRVIELSTDEAEELENDLWAQITASKIDILSYDVFDTFLLRNNKPEARRYLELSQLVLDRLKKAHRKNSALSKLSANDLCEARAIGMEATYRTRDLVQACGEGLLDDVIKIQCRLLGLSQFSQSIFLQAEIDFEAANLVVNPVLLNIAKRFEKQGGTVIFVSDMYLRGETIVKIIKKMIDSSPQDHLFSSADLVISKRSGKIFAAIERELKAEKKRFLHIGDSWIGDVVRPREAGWNSIFFPVSKFELHEREKDLARLIGEMDDNGMESRSWAKV